MVGLPSSEPLACGGPSVSQVWRVSIAGLSRRARLLQYRSRLVGAPVASDAALQGGSPAWGVRRPLDPWGRRSKDDLISAQWLRGRFMSTYIWIAVGGALGSMARYFVSSSFARLWGEAFPWGTIIVNITGCFVIGILATTTGPDGRVVVAPDFRQFLLIGICGGYTTFSSFSLQTLNLLRDGEWSAAGANAAVSFLACMLAVWAGAVFGQWINQIRAA